MAADNWHEVGGWLVVWWLGTGWGRWGGGVGRKEIMHQIHVKIIHSPVIWTKSTFWATCADEKRV